MSTSAVLALGVIALASMVEAGALVVVVAATLRVRGRLRTPARLLAHTGRTAADRLGIAAVHVGATARSARHGVERLQHATESLRTDVESAIADARGAIHEIGTLLQAVASTLESARRGFEGYQAAKRRPTRLQASIGRGLSAYS